MRSGWTSILRRRDRATAISYFIAASSTGASSSRDFKFGLQEHQLVISQDDHLTRMTHSSTGYMSLSNLSTVFASSDKSQTGRDFSAPGCGNENMVSNTGEAIDRIVLCTLNSTTLGPPDRRIMSAVGELSKSCGIAERERYRDVVTVRKKDPLVEFP